MYRPQIMKAYDVQNGVIRSPGKFEGEPVFAPYYWGLVLDGGADSEDGGDGEPLVSTFELVEGDHTRWPELGKATTLRIWEDEQGFVHCETNEP